MGRLVARAVGPRRAVGCRPNQNDLEEASMYRAKRLSSRLILAACLLLAAGSASPVQSQTPASTATLFEGARLITGDGSTPIENSAFVVENNRFTAVGRRGEVMA